MFHNMWTTDLSQYEAILSQPMILGFSVGGGAFDGNHLSSGIVKTIFLHSEKSTKHQKAHSMIAQLFKDAHFEISYQNNILGWYLDHFIMNGAMSAYALYVNRYNQLYQSPRTLLPAIKLLKQMIPLIKAMNQQYVASSRPMLILPASLISTLVFKVITGKGVMGEIMRRVDTYDYITEETMATFPKMIMQTAKDLSYDLPVLETIMK